MAGHLLALEHLTRVLTLTGRTVRTVRDRHTVRGAKTAEVVALHGTSKTLTDRGAGDIHQLAFGEVISLHRCANLDEVVGIDAELGDLPLGLDLGDGELATIGLGDVLRLGLPAPSWRAT